ncbi:MAG: hypothetical protein AAF226_05270 [Verrucomicrobiota bacterium]
MIKPTVKKTLLMNNYRPENLPIGPFTLGNRAVLQLVGQDAVRYLNGQVTNNVALDLSNRSLPACICTIKGKVEALVWITKHPNEEGLLIDCCRKNKEAIFMRLDKYLIADDCELSDVSTEWSVRHSFQDGDGTVESNRFGIAGFDLWTQQPEEEAQELAPVIAQLEVLNMIPREGAEIRADSFPSELGLDKWAVDFHKGCYLGQEIVSRLESVGKSKRSLKIIESDQKIGADTSYPEGEKRPVLQVFRDSIPNPLGEGWLTLGLYKEGGDIGDEGVRLFGEPVEQ